MRWGSFRAALVGCVSLAGALWSLALGCTALGCNGDIGDGGLPAPPATGDTWACTPGDPSPTELPRLSHTQYVASLAEFIGAAIGTGEVDAVLTALEPTLTLLPNDSSLDHDRLDQAVSQGHVDAQYYLAVAAARELTATPARFEALVGSCGTNADPDDDEACLSEMIARLGYHALRRPLTGDEIAFYRNDVFEPADGMDPAAIRDVVAAMLLAPNFIYRVEMDGDPVDDRDDLYTLSAHELAVRLAFHFWDAPPDEQLYAAADSLALLTDDGYAAEVDRMLDDPRSQATFDRYFAEWLRLDDLAPLHQQLGQADYDAFVGAMVPTPDLRDALIEDALALTRYLSWDAGGTLADLFTSDLSFATRDDVSAIYGGVPLWQPGSEPLHLPSGERAGILTRPAMLATGSIKTHPVLRGRDVRRRVLCQDLPPPPADAMNNLPTLDPIITERERMEAQTMQPDSQCIGCHSLMNPIGYTLEGYDGLGRRRSEETLYAADGEVLAVLPLDTESTPRIDAGDDSMVTNPVELSQRVAESNHTRRCFARHYFRFTFERVEDDDVDGCELETMRAALSEGRSLREVFRDIVMSPTFRQRKLAP